MTFECQSPNNSTNIVWTQGPKVVFNNGYRTVVTPLHFSLTTPFTLSITGVQDQDAGQYGCNVLDYGSVSAQLTVAGEIQVVVELTLYNTTIIFWPMAASLPCSPGQVKCR